jgi:hypothetical protein
MNRILLSTRGLAAAVLVLATGCGGSGSSTPTTPVAATPTPVPMPPAVSPAGLVLLLHMDEAAWDGTPAQVRDASGLGHHGTAVGGASTVAGGRFGRAGSFPGSSGCVSIADEPGLRPDSELTVSAWLMSSALGHGAAMGLAAKRVNFQVASAFAFFLGRTTASAWTSTPRTTASKWARRSRTAVGTTRRSSTRDRVRP